MHRGTGSDEVQKGRAKKQGSTTVAKYTIFAQLIGLLVLSSTFAPYKIAFIPKLIGIPYFNAMEAGAKRAAQKLGVEFIYTGPTTDSVAKQIELIDNLITRGVDAIAVAPNDPAAISPILQKVTRKGILALTSDTDAKKDARKIFINQARARDIGHTIMDVIAEILDDQGEFAIISGGPTAWNLNTWIMHLQERSAQYPDIELMTIRYAGEDVQKAVDLTLSVIQAFPRIKVIAGMNSTSAPGIAQAIDLANKRGLVFATGIALPSMMRKYVKKKIVPKFVSWDPEDLGYLTIWAAKRLLDDSGFPANTPIEVPGIRTKPIYYPKTTELVLGPPLILTPENIDDYPF